MLCFFKVRNFFAALVLVAGLTGGNAAQASDCYRPQCYWKTVVTYVTVAKPYVGYAIQYDHCGQPHAAKVVRYQNVQVPVTRQVKVCY